MKVYEPLKCVYWKGSGGGGGGGVGLETYICTQSLQNVWVDAHSLQTHCSLTVFINGGEVFINGGEGVNIGTRF